MGRSRGILVWWRIQVCVKSEVRPGRTRVQVKQRDTLRVLIT